jgi:hypothetical protein
MLAETVAHSRRTSRLVLRDLLSSLQSTAGGQDDIAHGGAKYGRPGRVRIAVRQVIFFTVGICVVA